MNLNDLGWSLQWQSVFEANHTGNGLIPARVSREDKQAYLVLTECGERVAVAAGKLWHAAQSGGVLPAVGDWVAVARDANDGPAVIHAVLPRRSAFSRKIAGRRSDAQIVAANVDDVLIICGLDGDYNLRRIERYLTLAYGSGAAPLVVLSKADLCDDVAARIDEVERSAPGAPVVAVHAFDAQSVAQIRPQIAPGRTAALLGSSGAGKSTLINALAGRDIQKTGAVRDGDDRGRHTTTRRELFLLAGGGIVIDTPGMRELQLTGDAAEVGGAFSDIQALSQNCRFRDCQHSGEPGCAVIDAVNSGALSDARLANYRKLQREQEYAVAREDPAVQRERTDRWKRIHKAAKRHMKQKYKW